MFERTFAVTGRGEEEPVRTLRTSLTIRSRLETRRALTLAVGAAYPIHTVAS